MSNLVKGILVSGLPPILRIGIGFYLTSYLVNYLTIEDYGLWKLSVSLFAISWMFQLGFNSVLGREIPIAQVNKQDTRISRLVSTVFFSYLVIAIAVASIAYLFLDHILIAFNFTGNKSAYLVFLVVIIGYTVWMPLSVFRSVFLANRWFVSRANIESFGHVVFLISVWGATFFHYPVFIIAICSAGRLIFGVLVNSIYSIYKSNIYIPKIKLFDFSIIKENLSFGFNSTVFSLATFLLANSSIWLAAILGSSKTVASISIAVQLSAVFTALLSIMLVVIKPEISKLDAENDPEKITIIYLNSVRTIFLVSIPFAVFLSFFNQKILLLWLGEGVFGGVGAYLFWFAGAQVCWLFIQVSYFVVNALGKHKFIALLTTLSLVGSVFCSYFLVKKFDNVELGLAMGLALPLAFSSILVLPLYMIKILKISLHSFYEIIVKQTVIPCFFIILLMWLISIRQFELYEWVSMLFVVLFYYVGVLWLFGISKKEKTNVVDFFRKRKGRE